ncbi:unnamed protein product [Caenorhabditis auriculariae]|uniref:Amino acid permease/ SLC12A domain-containing protein n=1 Tax=Caenorhabditis auriculariae TaxID=2777116 RepID=A0A8S1H4L0_9PELO|nr:unnamed protein product [Caenorhabditis auriculariae]
MWQKVLRRRPLDDQFLRHSEWVRRLGIPLVISLAGIKSVSLMLFIILPVSLTTFAGPSTIFALIITFLVVFLSAAHLAELSCAMPKNCVHYHFAYSALGELPAFLIAWASLLEYLAQASLFCRAWADHFNLLFRGAPQVLSISFASEDSSFLSSNVDFLTVIAAVITLSILMCSIRVVGTICVSLLAVALLISASCSLVAFFHADPDNWIRAKFFTFGFQGVLHAICALCACYTGVESTTSLLEETKNPRKRVSGVFSFLVVALTAIFFIATLVFSLCTNVSELSDSILLPEIFTMLNIPAAKYMLTVCSVCALSGGVLASFLPATRVIAALCNDRLIPYAKDSSTKSPYFAVLLCTVLVSASALVRKSALLNFVVFAAPAKLVVTIALTYIQHFLTEPIGIPHETSNYKSIGKRRLRISMNDGVSTDEEPDRPEDCASHSTFDTTAFLYLSAARAESDRLQKKLEKVQQLAEFNENQPVLPKSVSQYHTMESTRPTTLTTHNCIAHQCETYDRNVEDSQHVHLFGNGDCEMPFFSSYPSTPRPTSPSLLSSQNDRSALILIVFIVATMLMALILRNFGLKSSSSVVLVALFLLLIVTCTVLACKLPTNDYLHRRTAKVPLFPVLSFLPLFILLLSIFVSTSWSTFVHATLAIIFGLFLYASYGFRHSALRNQRCVVIENQFPDDIDQYHPIMGDDRTSVM